MVSVLGRSCAIKRPGEKIRVLVVDDSVVIRRLVTYAIEQSAELEVVGAAANGVIALQKIPQVNPDVITLDVEMPEMDGLETLRELRKLYPQLFVIMFSTLTERGAATTLDALMLGANDYVTKSSKEGSFDQSMARLREELVPKIKQFFQIVDKGSSAPAPKTVATTKSPTPRFPGNVGRPKIVAIGVSTGGPTALGEIIPELPGSFPVPIVMVQHMPPLFTRLLAERLQSKSKIRVQEAVQGSLVEPGTVLIAPGDYHMRVVRKGNEVCVALDQSPPENSCRPAVDVLFRSVGELYGSSTLGVILTGMGYDGLRGVELLKAEGAQILAQDRDSSVVWGMPGAVVEAGLADAALSLKSIAPEIQRRVGA